MLKKIIILVLINYIFIVFQILGNENSKNTLLIPLPNIPKIVFPYNSLDIYSTNIISQIHAGLFEIDKYGNPLPNMLKDFSYDSTNKYYRLTLKKGLKFHNGKKVNSDLVKKSLEKALQSQAARIDSFKCIKDYRKKNISGIKVIDSLNLHIKLTCDDYELPKKLADYRYSIFDPSDRLNGVGDYGVAHVTSNLIVLKNRFNSNDNYFKYIKFVKQQDMDRYISYKYIMFNMSYPTDYFKKQLLLRENKIFSLKNYLLAINSKKIPRGIRQKIINNIDRKKIINGCYPGNNIDDNFLPSGFQGYIKNLIFFKKSKKSGCIPVKQKYSILILTGVGNESCVEKMLKKQFCGKITIRQENAQKASDMWLTNKVDMLFLYMEAEKNLDMFNFYLKSDSFTLGDNYNNLLKREHAKLLATLDPKVIFTRSQKLVKAILGQLTVLPLFIPHESIFFTPNVLFDHQYLSSPTYMKYSRIKKK